MVCCCVVALSLGVERMNYFRASVEMQGNARRTQSF